MANNVSVTNQAHPLNKWWNVTTEGKTALLIEALEIAQNSYEYDGERHKADAVALLIFDIKEGK